MRICLIANKSIHTRRLALYLLEAGHQVHLVPFGRATAPMPEGVAEHRLPSLQALGKARWPVWVWLVRRAVQAVRPHVLHAHQVATAGWLGAAAGWHPLVVTAWGSDLMLGARRSAAQRRLARWVFQRADYVTCVSTELASVARTLGARPQRLAVAPWGVDLDVYHPPADRAAARERLGLGSGPLVLSARSVKPVYRPLDVARAIPLVLESVPEASFVVRTHNSEAPLLEQFRATVEGAGAGSAVRYAGDLADEEDIADLYRAADVVISVPESDGTPSSVLEALACGAVPVVSDLPSLREWVEEGKQALLVPVGDAGVLARAVTRLLRDEALRRTMAKNGAQVVRERADSRLWMRRSEEVYRLVADGA